MAVAEGVARHAVAALPSMCNKPRMSETIGLEISITSLSGLQRAKMRIPAVSARRDHAT